MTVKMTYDAKAKEIVIRVPFDEKAEYPDSASGKTQAVATTHGAAPVEGAPNPKLRVNMSVWLTKK